MPFDDVVEDVQIKQASDRVEVRRLIESNGAASVFRSTCANLQGCTRGSTLSMIVARALRPAIASWDRRGRAARAPRPDSAR